MNLGEGGRRGRRGLLALTSIASFMVALDLLVVSTALTTIQSDLAASTETVQWIVTAYGLTFAGLLMTGAGLGDRFGRRCVFTIGLAVFAAASVGCALRGVGEVAQVAGFPVVQAAARRREVHARPPVDRPGSGMNHGPAAAPAGTPTPTSGC